MMNTPGNLSPRDRVLRAIGRNLYNFQRLERFLKALTGLTTTCGPMSSIGEKIALQSAKRERYTLGQILGDWLNMPRQNEQAVAKTEDLFEPWVTISFGFELGSRYLEENGPELTALAKERNHLVHHQLFGINLDSKKACTELAELLDAQNHRINQQVLQLAPAIEDIRGMAEVARQPGMIDKLTEEMIRLSNANDT